LHWKGLVDVVRRGGTNVSAHRLVGLYTTNRITDSLRVCLELHQSENGWLRAAKAVRPKGRMGTAVLLRQQERGVPFSSALLPAARLPLLWPPSPSVKD
jgi:hypothetical protein